MKTRNDYTDCALSQQKRSLASQFAVVAIAASSALALVVALVIIPYLSTTAQESQRVERKIVALNSSYDYSTGHTTTKVQNVKVGDMQPNTVYWFLNPFGKTMEGQNPTLEEKLKPGNILDESEWDIVRENEPFEFYMLIRLPEWLGGAINDVSAYRAYSAIAISDQCLSRYWGNEGRWRIEDPCGGDLYRPWDAIATGGPAAVGITGRGIVSPGYFNGLASLDLFADSDGYITAKKPNLDYFSNGVAGEGRRFTQEKMQESNAEMIALASEYEGYSLPFVPSIPTSQHYLSEVRPMTSEPWSLKYPTYEIPLVLEGAYFTSPSSGDFGYDEIVIRAYSLDAFPSLRLDSPEMTTQRIDLTDDKSKDEYAKINQTTLNSLIHLDWFDNVNNRTREIESGTDVSSGYFAVLIAPAEIETGEESAGSGALIWGRSVDGGKDILVTIRASTMDMQHILELAKSLPIKTGE